MGHDRPDGAGRPDPTTGTEEAPASAVGVLSAIEQLVHEARSMPMSASVLVAREELLDLLEQAKQTLPPQISRAEEILVEAEGALSSARVRAEEIVDAARRQAAHLVDTEQVTLAARERAAEIIADAQQTARDVIREADDHADRRLADLELDLGKVLAQVQAGRARLAGRLDTD